MDSKFHNLKQYFNSRSDIKFSFLFGSQARGDANEKSDWDFAIYFESTKDKWLNLGLKEDIRHDLTKLLKTDDRNIDIVVLNDSNLGISVTVVEEGIVMSEQDSLELAYYYQRIWAKREDFFWNLEHAV